MRISQYDLLCRMIGAMQLSFIEGIYQLSLLSLCDNYNPGAKTIFNNILRSYSAKSLL